MLLYNIKIHATNQLLLTVTATFTIVRTKMTQRCDLQLLACSRPTNETLNEHKRAVEGVMKKSRDIVNEKGCS